MEPTVTTTKEMLLLGAGELFAEHGVAGTSIRAIAEKCRANIAAVNYHFGGKENLYLAVIRHVLAQTRCRRAEELILRKEEWMHDPAKCADALYRIVEEHVQQYFTGTHPRWYGRIFMRVLLQPTPSVWEIMEGLLMPNLNSLRAVLLCCRPGMSFDESELWADTLIGQLAHYIFAEEFMLIIPHHRKLHDAAYQKDILCHVARVMIRGLQLPMPDALREAPAHA